MNIKYLISIAALGGIGYQSYSRFKDFINNIKVATLNYVKNLDETFTIDVIASNNLMSIIPYKIADIKFVDDNNQVIAVSENAWDLDKTTNIKFRVPDYNLVASVQNIGNYFRSLDVEITYNFFLFQHTRRYQQVIINEGELLTNNTLMPINNDQLLADNTLMPVNNIQLAIDYLKSLTNNTQLPINTNEDLFINQKPAGGAACNCESI